MKVETNLKQFIFRCWDASCVDKWHGRVIVADSYQQAAELYSEFVHSIWPDSKLCVWVWCELSPDDVFQYGVTKETKVIHKAEPIQ